MKIYAVALLLVVGILGGFYGGYKVGHNNVSANTTSNQGTKTGGVGGGGQGFAGARGFGAACPSPGAPSPSPGINAVARGTVTNLSSSSMTITNTSCDVKVVFGSTVQVSKTVAGSTSDLKDNITITVIGTRQADGSIKATTIQLGNSSIQIGGGQAPAAGGG